MKIEYTNNINTKVRVEVQQDEDITDQNCFIEIERPYEEMHCYFNTIKDFFDWIDSLNKLKDQLKIKLSNYPELWENKDGL